MSQVTIAVASGKGGTGKTLIATNLAAFLADHKVRVTLADCDVESPNDHLFLEGPSERTLVTVPVPHTPVEACPLGCAVCRDTCTFGAIRMLGGKPVVFPDLCHNCGACVDECPENVLRESDVSVGYTDTGLVREGLTLVTGTMDVGQSKAPAMIDATRSRAAATGSEVLIFDSPPGAACSAVATLHGVDLLVLVTEPTIFGLHDLTLMVDLAKQLGLPTVVVVNRVGIGSVDVAGYCHLESISIICEIPFDRAVAGCYAEGALLIDRHSAGTEWFSALWDALKTTLSEIEAKVRA